MEASTDMHCSLENWPVWVNPADQPRRSTGDDGSSAFFRNGEPASSAELPVVQVSQREVLPIHLSYDVFSLFFGSSGLSTRVEIKYG